MTQFTCFYIKLQLSMLQNVVGGGGYAPPLWFRDSWNTRRQPDIVTGIQASCNKVVKRMTLHYLSLAVPANLRHASKSRQLVARCIKSTDLVLVVPTSLTHFSRNKLPQSHWQLLTRCLVHTIQYQVCLNDIVKSRVP